MILLLILLALLIGGIGLVVKGLLWLLIIAAALFVAGTLLGFRAGRGQPLMNRTVDITSIRGQLERERFRLAALLGDQGSSHEDGLDRTNEAIGDPADLASLSTQQEMDHTIRQQLQQQLAEVAAALARIEDGTYGFDEVTGEPIDRLRLEAVPTARRNVVA